MTGADRITFHRIVPGDPAAGADTAIMIHPRTGDRWRVTIFDTANLGDDICHVSDIHTPSNDPIELLRLALNDYRDHRPTAP